MYPRKESLILKNKTKDKPTNRFENNRGLQIKSIKNRLTQAPIIALTSFMAVSPFFNNNIAQATDHSNVFNTLGNSPLQKSYEMVDSTMQDKSAELRLAELFNTRMEQNNVGNLPLNDETINQTAIKESQIVLDYLKNQGNATPTWENIANFKGDDNVANQLAEAERSIGAESMSKHTRAVFSDQTVSDKIQDSKILLNNDIKKGWTASSKIEDVKAITIESLRAKYIKQKPVEQKTNQSSVTLKPEKVTLTPSVDGKQNDPIEPNLQNTPENPEASEFKFDKETARKVLLDINSYSDASTSKYQKKDKSILGNLIGGIAEKTTDISTHTVKYFNDFGKKINYRDFGLAALFGTGGYLTVKNLIKSNKKTRREIDNIVNSSSNFNKRRDNFQKTSNKHHSRLKNTIDWSTYQQNPHKNIFKHELTMLGYKINQLKLK
jgi:hypothetical protein